jgi:hypothetical protein
VAVAVADRGRPHGANGRPRVLYPRVESERLRLPLRPLRDADREGLESVEGAPPRRDAPPVGLARVRIQLLSRAASSRVIRRRPRAYRSSTSRSSSSRRLRGLRRSGRSRRIIPRSRPSRPASRRSPRRTEASRSRRGRRPNGRGGEDVDVDEPRGGVRDPVGIPSRLRSRSGGSAAADLLESGGVLKPSPETTPRGMSTTSFGSWPRTRPRRS